MFPSYSKGCDDPAVKALAAKTLPRLEAQDACDQTGGLTLDGSAKDRPCEVAVDFAATSQDIFDQIMISPPVTGMTAPVM